MDIIAQANSRLSQANLPPGVVASLTAAKLKTVATKVPTVNRTVMPGALASGVDILLFQGYQDQPRALQELLEAYGELVLRRAGPVGLEIWNRKLALVEPLVVDDFTQKLSSRQFTTYRALVESMTDPVYRLVGVHLANALIHYKVPIADAFNLDVRVWPQTAGLATGQAPYSATPLVTAYCNPDLITTFPTAFKNYVQTTLTCGHQSVLAVLRQIIESVCEAA